MKALILAGGRGKRLDEVSTNSNKCMIPISGKPAIEYSLCYAAATDISEIVVVVGYQAEKIINFFGNRYDGRKLNYVIQWEQKGLVHAIGCAKDAIGKEDFMLLLGDEILVNPRHRNMLDEFTKTNVFALCGILHVDNKELIKRTYTLINDDDNTIYRLVEKPRNPLNNLMGTGQCVFDNATFEYVDVTPIHHERKEKELPDLIQCAIDDGKLVKSFVICDKYTNINSKEDIRTAESFFK